MKRGFLGFVVVLLCLTFAAVLFEVPIITGFATNSEATEAIAQAEADLQELREANFTTLYIQDTLALAREALSDGNYVAATNYALAISERKEKAYALQAECRSARHNHTGRQGSCQGLYPDPSERPAPRGDCSG